MDPKIKINSQKGKKFEAIRRAGTLVGKVNERSSPIIKVSGRKSQQIPTSERLPAYT